MNTPSSALSQNNASLDADTCKLTNPIVRALLDTVKCDLLNSVVNSEEISAGNVITRACKRALQRKFLQSCKEKKAKNKLLDKKMKGSKMAAFLPKFNNIKKSKLVYKKENKTFLIVFDKLSGSLGLLNGFHSKNGTNNQFSRSLLIILENSYISTLGKIEGPKKLGELLKYIDDNNISPCFEVVAGNLGDHGATPKSAFAALLAVTVDGVSWPLHKVIEFAEEWLLDLPCMRVIDPDNATEIEKTLHSIRFYESSATQVNNFLDKSSGVISKCGMNHFLFHGDVLEGFVIRESPLEILDDLIKIIQKYNETMSLICSMRLEGALELGKLCNSKDPEYLKRLQQSAGGVRPIDPITGEEYTPSEPVYVQMTDDEKWKFIFNNADGKLRTMLETLKRSYSKKIILTFYTDKKGVRVIVNIKNDEVFYSIPLHIKMSKCSTLERGLVLRFEYTTTPTTTDTTIPDVLLGTLEYEQSDELLIKPLGIAKLKCLNYIWRTFGVRNTINDLITKGKLYYMTKLIPNLFDNWNIPTDCQSALISIFDTWADFVFDILTNEERKQLNEYPNTYLKYLEPLLASNNPRLYPAAKLVTGIVCDSATSLTIGNASLLPPIAIVGDFPTSDILLKILKKRGYVERSLTKLEELGPGSFRHYKNIPPITKDLDISHLIIFGPEGKQMEALNKRVPDICQITNPTDEQILAIIEERTFNSSDFPNKEVNILTGLAIPTGGGKSSLLKAIKGIHMIVSSDACAKRSINFDSEFLKTINEAPDGATIGYDKNIPDLPGLLKLIKLLRSLPKYIKINLMFIVPASLDDKQIKMCIERVETREGHECLSITTPDYLGIIDFFVRTSRRFLDDAQKMNGALVTNAMFENTNFEGITLEQLLSIKSPLDKLYTRNIEQDQQDQQCNYVEGMIPGTGLHVTILPPKSTDSLKDWIIYKGKLSKLVGKILTCLISRYVIFTKKDDIDSKKDIIVGVFLVNHLDGLEEDQHYPLQRPYYHITDNGSLFNCRSVQGRIMTEHYKNGTIPEGWTIEVVDYPPQKIQVIVTLV